MSRFAMLIACSLFGISQVRAGLGPAADPRTAEQVSADAGSRGGQATGSAGSADAKHDGKSPINVYYKDGFFLETADGKFSLRIGGVLHFDTRLFAGDGRSPNAFDIRRARYDLRGTLYKGDLENVFRLQVELADEPYLRNAYWIFRARPAFQVQVGQFKVPGGADQLSEESHLNFIEYAAASPVSPFFDRGINLHSHLLDERFQWCLALVTGSGVDRDVNAGDNDDHKDVVVRTLVSPLRGGDGPLQGLRLGGTFQYGLQSIATRRGETGLRTESYQSKWFNWEKKYLDLDQRRRYELEAHLIEGPVTVSYEYNRVEWRDITVYADDRGSVDFSLPGTTGVDVHQIWASWFLTGESKAMDDVFFAWRQPKPKHNLSLADRTWGAWEIAARYARYQASERLFESGVLDGSIRGYALTGGLRWLWNPKCKLLFDLNYLHSDRGKGIVTESAGKGVAAIREYADEEVGFLFRLLLSF